MQRLFLNLQILMRTKIAHPVTIRFLFFFFHIVVALIHHCILEPLY